MNIPDHGKVEVPGEKDAPKGSQRVTDDEIEGMKVKVLSDRVQASLQIALPVFFIKGRFLYDRNGNLRLVILP